MSYDPNTEADLRRALADGVLSIQVDAPRPVHTHKGGRITFEGDATFDAETLIRVVHVISKPARGEIRGYVVVVETGEIFDRGPRYVEWPALDTTIANTLKEQGVAS